MAKYRYFMNGMFEPTDGESYEINIPSPFIRDSEEDAKADGIFGYRFAWIDDIRGPEILCYEGHNFALEKKDGERYIKDWVEGECIKRYNYDEFIKENGYIRQLDPEVNKKRPFVIDEKDFIDTDKTFRDVFPNMKKQHLYYIDDEAYFINEIEE